MNTAVNTARDLWAKLAAPVDPSAIQWRQDGRPVARGQKFVARFVAYIEAGTVRERLDTVVPGEWDLTLDPLAPFAGAEADDAISFKARLQVLGVIREDVGSGKDYKQASTDAFKRAAVRFGIGHELYELEQLWVEVDGDGKFAKPLVDPAEAYRAKYGQPSSPESKARAIGQAELPLPKTPELAEGASVRELLAAMKADPDMTPEQREYVDRHIEDGDKTDEELAALAVKVQEALAQVKQRRITDSMQRQRPGGNPQPAKAATRPAGKDGVNNDHTNTPHCPECGGDMWDNRLGKRNPKAPDFKCKNRQCEGVIWPPKPKGGAAAAMSRKPARTAEDDLDLPGALADEDDDLPF